MAISAARESSESVEPADVRQTLETILKSKHFVNAHKRKKFLQLICDYYLEGRAQELNEYTLAYDVFGRENGYNPSSDPIVRVVAHEIRKKLDAYYQTEGAKDAIRLEIPAGSYQPIFTRRRAVANVGDPESLAAGTSPDREAGSARRALSPWVVLLCLALAVAAAGI